MYSFEGRIRYSEVDATGKLTWVKLLDYFQDSCVFQQESKGCGIHFMSKLQMAWVLNSWQICLNRMPELYEEVRVITLPYELKGFFGFRNFVLETKDGERLAYANSIWTLVDMKKNLPTKIIPELDIYELDEKLDMDYCERKLAIPKEMKTLEEIPVTRHLIDTNGHVNNGRYVELAMALIPADYEVNEVRAEYKMQARVGDIFVPKIAEEDDKITVVMANQEDKVFATLQFLHQNK
ncbi:MAG: hypothetical protein E7282_04400 [Lachnospiraceae bacterium]|nr:hypothetical protein [Lachnospiraceae bacterium]